MHEKLGLLQTLVVSQMEVTYFQFIHMIKMSCSRMIKLSIGLEEKMKKKEFGGGLMGRHGITTLGT